MACQPALGHFGDVVDKVAKGDNVARVQLPPTDEIGQLGVAFDHMLDERIATQRRIEKENDQLNNSVVEIMTSVAELAQRNLSVKVPVSEDVTGAVSDAINMMTRSTATALGKVRSISNVVSSASENVRPGWGSRSMRSWSGWSLSAVRTGHGWKVTVFIWTAQTAAATSSNTSCACRRPLG